VDDHLTDVGGACATSCPGGTLAGCVGACTAGAIACVNGSKVCAGSVGPSPEVCDGLDNDCNGIVDDVPGIGAACTGGGVATLGACTAAWACTGVAGPGPSGLTCEQVVGPKPEVCNGVDDDCNGSVDDSPTD